MFSSVHRTVCAAVAGMLPQGGRQARSRYVCESSVLQAASAGEVSENNSRQAEATGRRHGTGRWSGGAVGR